MAGRHLFCRLLEVQPGDVLGRLKERLAVYANRSGLQAFAVVSLLQLVGLTGAHALTLDEAVVRAMARDPQWLVAQAERESTRYRADQARGVLRPQVSLTANTTFNSRGNRSRGVLDPDRSPQNFNSRGTRIELRHPVWNPEAKARFRKALKEVEQAGAKARAELGHLVSRVLEAMSALASAQADIAARQAQVQLATHRALQARKGVRVGSGKRLDRAEALSELAAATAELKAAEIETKIKRLDLEQLVGFIDATESIALSRSHKSPEKASVVFANYEAQARSSNPELRAALFALEVASLEIRRAARETRPTVELVAGFGTNRSGLGDSAGQPGFKRNEGSIGLQFRVPIYDGGQGWAKVLEAGAARNRASFDVQAAREQAVLRIRRAALSWQAARLRQTAAQQARIFHREALKKARKSRQTGLATVLRVYEATAALEQAKAEFLRAELKMRSQHLVAHVQAGGSLTSFLQLQAGPPSGLEQAVKAIKVGRPNS